MKICKSIMIATLIFVFQNSSRSQVETAIPFLSIPVSSQSAMGSTGTSLPTDDPYGFLLNPAQLGYTSQHNNLAFILYPSSVNWLGGLDNLKLSGIALNIGYNFKDVIGIPLSAGIGFANPGLNFGDAVRYPPVHPLRILSTGSRDYYYAYSFGVGIDYYIQFSAGITYKDITSVLSGQPVGAEQVAAKAEVSAIDYGLLINFPVLKMIDDNLFLHIIDNVPAKPFFNLSSGLSRSNIGDEVYYIDQAQSDPLPRSARLGYGISAGFDLIFEQKDLSAFDLAFSTDAWDILVSHDSTGKFEYQSGFGNINFSKHVLEIKGDENVVSHAGMQLSLLETLFIKRGHFNGRGFHNVKTNGIEIRLKGLAKLYNLISDDATIKFIADHLDIRFYKTNYFVDLPIETEFIGVALFVGDFAFIE